MNICVCVYIFISNYYLLTRYNVTCRYVSKADHLVFNRQLVCSSQENTIFYTLRMSYALLFLCSSGLGGRVGETLWVSPLAFNITRKCKQM